MIHEREGRVRSVLTKEEIRDQIAKDLAAMTPEEREAVQALLKDVIARKPGPDSLYARFTEAEYRHPPVDIETFVSDEYYCGESCRTLYPVLKEDLKSLFAGGHHIAVFTGSVGAGKSFAGSIALVYTIYQISCLRDPHATFGLAPGADITTVVFSVTRDLARDVTYKNIVDKVSASPYFREHFPTKVLQDEIRFPNGVFVRPLASNDTTALGRNVIAVMLDEGNFFNQNSASKRKFERRFGVGADQATVIFRILMRRVASRFMKRGRLPGIFVIASSKQTESDFTAQLLKDAENDSSVFARDHALWDVKPEDYGPKRFFVLCGVGGIGNRILRDDEVDAVRASLSEGATIVSVPEDLRKNFEQDIDGSTRDLAGVSVVGVTPYFRRQDRIIAAIDRTRKHPFSTLVYDQRGGGFLWDELVAIPSPLSLPFQVRNTAEANLPRPRFYPYAARCAHLDLSVRNDRTGVCVGCIAGWKDMERRSEDGRSYLERAPVYFIDLMLAVVPPAGGEIDLGGVRNLVYEMSDHGFYVSTVSLDRFQPYEAMQVLTHKGYQVELLKLSKSTAVYDVLREALYEGRVILYDYGPLLSELRLLEVDAVKKRVDHPPNGRCFVGSTRVAALDGSFPTLAELDGVELWVHAATPTGEVVPGRAVGKCTGLEAELVEVTLDSGAVERCTPDHLWMLEDGSYRAAFELRVGVDRLMAKPRLTYEVRAVAPVKRAEPIPVYDLTVERYHNFLLFSGVFVHNSDLSDALAGCVYTLSQRKVQAPLPIIRPSGQSTDAWFQEQEMAAGAARGVPAGPGSDYREALERGILLPLIG